MNETDASLDALQDRIGHRFRNPALLRLSLAHPSLQQEDPAAENNQRLEFLGDAVLQMIVTERLHALFPNEREGSLTRRRAILTRGAFLTHLATELGIDRVLQVSIPERAARGHERPAALEDATEALVAAIYLDSDLETTRRVVLAWFGDLTAVESRARGRELNPKGRLQELVQPMHGNNALSYRLAATSGPPHDRRFEVEVLFLETVIGRGAGASKKEAEEAAASEALGTWRPPAT